MLDKKRGYAYNRPFYAVDVNATIMAGMVAFRGLNAVGVAVATTAVSGLVPIGTFWKDRAATYRRTTVENGTFNANNIIALSAGNIRAANAVRVTNAAGVAFTQNVDYTVTLANGVVTRLVAGAIAALATVVVWYEYNLQVGTEHWDRVSTQWTQGVNYDRQPDDTLGSGEITVAEGDAKLFTDQFDPTQTYALNNVLRSDATSRWTTAVTIYSRCGRVIQVPTANDPFLGLDQIRVAF